MIILNAFAKWGNLVGREPYRILMLNQLLLNGLDFIMSISKDKSTFIKGIVLIMMIFLHLFNGNHTELCTNHLYVFGEPFAK